MPVQGVPRLASLGRSQTSLSRAFPDLPLQGVPTQSVFADLLAEFAITIIDIAFVCLRVSMLRGCPYLADPRRASPGFSNFGFPGRFIASVAVDS